MADEEPIQEPEEIIEIPIVCEDCGREIDVAAGEGVVVRRLKLAAPSGFGGVITSIPISQCDPDDLEDKGNGKKKFKKGKDPNTRKKGTHFSGLYCTTCYPSQQFDPPNGGA